MSVARIRGFLLQLPKPSLLRVTSRDGEPQELKLSKSFAKTADSVVALDAELVECLDASGAVLRAMRISAVDARRSDAAEIPVGLQADPNALMLTHFANLLHRAYEHSTEIAFVKLVDLTERLNDRSEAIEQRLERAEAANRRLLQDQVDDAMERVEDEANKAQEGGGDLLQQLGGAFLSGQLQSKPPVKTNGAAHKPKGS
jgi:hypothetical protein